LIFLVRRVTLVIITCLDIIFFCHGPSYQSYCNITAPPFIMSCLLSFIAMALLATKKNMDTSVDILNYY